MTGRFLGVVRFLGHVQIGKMHRIRLIWLGWSIDLR